MLPCALNFSGQEISREKSTSTVWKNSCNFLFYFFVKKKILFVLLFLSVFTFREPKTGLPAEFFSPAEREFGSKERAPVNPGFGWSEFTYKSFLRKKIRNSGQRLRRFLSCALVVTASAGESGSLDENHNLLKTRTHWASYCLHVIWDLESLGFWSFCLP